MKAEKFSESLTNIQDKYIEEAAGASAPESRQMPDARLQPEPGVSENSSSQQIKGLKVWRIIAIAACAVLAVGIAAFAIGMVSDSRSDQSYNASLAPEGASYSTEGYYDGDVRSEEAYVPIEGDAEDYTVEGNKNAAAGSGDSLTVPTPSPANENAKIIYTASLTIETTTFEEAQTKISETTEKHGGYFESMDINNASPSYRSAFYQIRIPQSELDAFLNESAAFGNLVSAARNAEDVSENYYDVQARLESAQAKLKRLEELYAQADNMSDIIAIESEISNVQWEIDNLSGTIKHYDSQVDYSTVTLNLKEVYKINEEAAPLSFGERISKAFSDGLSGFSDAMENLLIWLAESWLWILLVILVVGAAIIITIKVANKDRKTNRQK